LWLALRQLEMEEGRGGKKLIGGFGILDYPKEMEWRSEPKNEKLDLWLIRSLPEG